MGALRRGEAWMDIADLLLRTSAEVVERAALLQRVANGTADLAATEAPAPELPAAEADMSDDDDVVEEAQPELIEEPKRRQLVNACGKSLTRPSRIYECCLVKSHKGDHLTDDGWIYNRVGRIWPDVRDLYLMIALNNNLVAASSAS